MRPVIAQMGADGVLRSYPPQPGTIPPLPQAPHRPIAPDADMTSPSPLDAIVWTFPELAGTGITVESVRNRVRWAWLWAVGASAHRQFASNLRLDDSWLDHATDLLLSRVYPQASAAVNGNLSGTYDMVQLLAGLDRIGDVFGPSVGAQFQAVDLGLRAEYELARSRPSMVAPTPQSRLRYRDVEGLFDDESAQLLDLPGGQLMSLLEVYRGSAYDIAAIARGVPTIAEIQSKAERERRKQQVIGAAKKMNQVRKDRTASAATARRARNSVEAQREARLRTQEARLQRQERRRSGWWF